MNKHIFSSFRYKDYRQEILRYLLLILIPLFFCVILYFSVQNVTIRQIEANAADTISQVYLRTSAMMHEVDIVNGSLFMDIASLNNASSDQALPYNLDNPASICRQLEIRKSGSIYIKHVYLISKEWQRIFSDFGYYRYSSLESLLNQVGTDAATLESIEETTWNMQTRNYLADPYCVIPYRDADGNVIGHILITLDLTVFVDTLSGLGASFVCLYNEDTLITSQLLTNDIEDVDWTDEKSVSAALGGKVKCFYVHRDDYTYMAAIPRAVYYRPFYTIAVSFIVYALLASFAGFLYLSKVSKERYRQLTDLISALPQNSKDTPVSYRELLPKVQEALLTFRDKETAGQSTEQERICHNALNGHYGKQISSGHLKKIGIQDGGTPCYVAVFYIRSMDTVALVSNHTDDVHEMVRVIFQSSMNEFVEQDIKIVYCAEPGRFVTVFYEPQSASFGEYIAEACECVCAFMADSYGIRMQVAVSSSVPAQDMVQAYRQAQGLEKFASAIDSSSYIISQDSLREGNGKTLMDGNFIRQEQILLNTLLMEKYDLIPSMVHSILQEHVQPLASDYTLASNRLHAISNLLTETLLNTAPEGVDVPAYTARLDTVGSIAALEGLVQEIYAPLAKAISSKAHSYKEVEQAQQYISDNLADKNLNVSMICEAVGIISQRLTPMFQEQLSMGIAEYVNYCRIEEAKKLLVSTKLTVKKIGEEVGYSTTDTFTRNFRKLENLTPTEYRQIVPKE